MKVLNENLVHIGVDVSTSEEAIDYMSNILLESGYVKEGYKEKILEREKSFPTGLIGKGLGIAIPHTVPGYTIKPAVCVLIPKRPVRFIMMGTEDKVIPAEIIMQMVIKDPKMQLSMLKKMMGLLKDVEKLQKIHSSKDKKEILKLLSFLEEE